MKNYQADSSVLGLQVSKFAIVGVLNTLIDVLIFNLLRKFTKVRAVVASYISTTIAMVNSYVLNKYWTFETKSTAVPFEALKFLFSTVIGMYLIHNGIVWILTEKWLWPSNFTLKIVRIFPLKFLSDRFIKDNSAKAIAILFSLVWNFLLYKFWVFS